MAPTQLADLSQAVLEPADALFPYVADPPGVVETLLVTVGRLGRQHSLLAAACARAFPHVSIRKSAPVSTATQEWGKIFAKDAQTFVSWTEAKESEISAAVMPSVVRELDPDQLVRSKFRRLAENWEDGTWAFSFPERKAMHRAYQQIIAMGASAVPPHP